MSVDYDAGIKDWDLLSEYPNGGFIIYSPRSVRNHGNEANYLTAAKRGVWWYATINPNGRISTIDKSLTEIPNVCHFKV